MKNKTIIFPERVSAITRSRHHTQKKGRGLVHFVEIETAEGDVFDHKCQNEAEAKTFAVGVYIKYELRKDQKEEEFVNTAETLSITEAPAKTATALNEAAPEKTKSRSAGKAANKKDTKPKAAAENKPAPVYEAEGPTMAYFDRKSASDFLFFDIETVRIQDKLEPGSALYDAWAYKMRNELGENDVEKIIATYMDKSPLFPEFNKIVCVSIGMVSAKTGKLYTKSFKGSDERELLIGFSKLLDSLSGDTILCGHSVLAFDIPVVANRCVVNGLRVPKQFDVHGIKPWDLAESVLDTAQMWRLTGGRWASLLSLATVLGLPSPKQDMDGSKVSDAYYAGEIEKIGEYCEKDVLTVANVVMRFMGLPVHDSAISSKNEQK